MDGDTTPVLDTDTALAEAPCRVTGDADGVIAVWDLTAAAEPGSLGRTSPAEAALGSAESDADPPGACDALEALGPDA
ncbi:hypothetical protein AB0B78_25655 [Streptomyces sp. NPDC040724]|uniref:hypothetical protein n=1 Tax=Streptomyces sp. NPDC040724 TaxID=3155612 RepID=UPI0033F5B4A0